MMSVMVLVVRYKKFLIFIIYLKGGISFGKKIILVREIKIKIKSRKKFLILFEIL